MQYKWQGSEKPQFKKKTNPVGFIEFRCYWLFHLNKQCLMLFTSKDQKFTSKEKMIKLNAILLVNFSK